METENRERKKRASLNLEKLNRKLEESFVSWREMDETQSKERFY